MSYNKNVFINCPFDEEYYSLLRPLLFTIIYLGYNPRIALERSDSGEIRLAKICEFIRESMYSIHDLSRLKSYTAHEFSRQNMPFELGLDIGCRSFSNNHLQEKKCLILETDKYRFMKAISDISGSDIKNHNNDPLILVRQVRNWFVETVGIKKVPSPTSIWYSFNDYAADFYEKRLEEGFSSDDLNIMPIPEYIDFIKEWCIKNRKYNPSLLNSINEKINANIEIMEEAN